MAFFLKGPWHVHEPPIGQYQEFWKAAAFHFWAVGSTATCAERNQAVQDCWNIPLEHTSSLAESSMKQQHPSRRVQEITQ